MNRILASFLLVSILVLPSLAKEGGARWDDPAFGIRWPIAARIMSQRDQNFPDFRG